MADKNTANIGFEKQIWDAACVLWGHIPAAEYRNVIIGLIFLRYISTAFDKKYKQLVAEGDGFEDDPDAYLEDNVFFVPADARWACSSHTTPGRRSPSAKAPPGCSRSSPSPPRSPRSCSRSVSDALGGRS